MKDKEVSSFGEVTSKYGENNRFGELPAVFTWFCSLLDGSATCFSGLVLLSVAYIMMFLFYFLLIVLQITFYILMISIRIFNLVSVPESYIWPSICLTLTLDIS